ncbi:MAG: hypothetical protein JO249_12225 [Acidobacteria bacterium]|nr:hypothetical protein [Acidobacteriota bacterium]MBV9481501.1 hypothetical protein [Acidobacteriota bacterium]
MIALELIFDDRQAIQRTVCERVALITYRENGRSFKQQQNWINEIHDVRSKCVHEGEVVGDESRTATTANPS